MTESFNQNSQWCIHCETAFPAGKEARGFGINLKTNSAKCSSVGLNSHILIDEWTCEKTRTGRRDPYSEIPQPGRRYPLYETGIDQ